MKKIKDLDVDCINYCPQYYDFFWEKKKLGEDWTVAFELTDEEIKYKSYYPIMNYVYPLPDDFEIEGKELKKLVKKMSGITVIYLTDEDGYFLALTDGGMDLTWEICEGYIILGYLPPAYLCRYLRSMPRTKLNSRTKRVLAACRRSLLWQKSQIETALRDLKRIRKEYANR